METRWFIYLLGIIAQGLFAARILVQWYKSEKNKKLESPMSYWVMSLIGSMMFFVYGWFRNDFSILFGQFMTYAIYIWNINAKGIWVRFPVFVRYVILVFPFLVIAAIMQDLQAFLQFFLRNEDIPLWLVMLGSAGQMIFSLRFVYQWLYSVRRGESLLPMGFWGISLVGSGLIICYAVIRWDPVLMLGHIVGFMAYSRNLMIGIRSGRHE